jgi:hypothetical protein
VFADVRCAMSLTKFPNDVQICNLIPVSSFDGVLVNIDPTMIHFPFDLTKGAFKRNASFPSMYYDAQQFQYVKQNANEHSRRDPDAANDGVSIVTCETTFHRNVGPWVMSYVSNSSKDSVCLIPCGGCQVIPCVMVVLMAFSQFWVCNPCISPPLCNGGIVSDGPNASARCTGNHFIPHYLQLKKCTGQQAPTIWRFLVVGGLHNASPSVSVVVSLHHRLFP